MRTHSMRPFVVAVHPEIVVTHQRFRPECGVCFNRVSSALRTFQTGFIAAEAQSSF